MKIYKNVWILQVKLKLYIIFKAILKKNNLENLKSMTPEKLTTAVENISE